MKLVTGISLLLMLLFCQMAAAYQHKKAILLVEKEAQVDSSGYNFVNELAHDVYNWIQSGQVVLWDSPEKKMKLSFNDLQGFELRSQSFLRTINSLYIYEFWNSDKKKTGFLVEGVSFTGTNYKGNDVIFGYVEYKGPFHELLDNTYMHVNANGNSGLTLNAVLMNKAYQYSLIYFDNGPLLSYKKSLRIVASAFNSKKQVLNFSFTRPAKLVEYGWDSLSKEQVIVCHRVINALNDFFNNNRQEFFNFGGDKIYSFLKDAPVAITDFHVIELWTKDKDGKIYYTPQTIIMFTKGYQLQPVSFDQLEKWKILYEGGSLTGYLSAKDYPYTIKKINETLIPYTLSQRYKDALFANSWNQILIKK